MSLFTRPARSDDSQAMCDLINPIIAEGATTAHRSRFDPERMIGHYISPPRFISCTTAWDDDRLLGFQTLEQPDPDWPDTQPVPPDWAIIATFVAGAAQGRGVGQALFAESRKAALRAGIETIDATIRADNVPGLAYYSKIGFRDYARLADVPLSDGIRVDRIRKRYDVTEQT